MTTQTLSEWARHRGISLYHFTDPRNIGSIKQHGGLYSWWQLAQRGIHKGVYSGSDGLSRGLDKRKGLEDYVKICFVPQHPQAYTAVQCGRIQRPTYIRVRLEVLDLDGIRISNENATADTARITDTQLDPARVADFFKHRINWRLIVDSGRKRVPSHVAEKAEWQAELMVPRHVPLRFLLLQNSGQQPTVDPPGASADEDIPF